MSNNKISKISDNSLGELRSFLSEIDNQLSDYKHVTDYLSDEFKAAIRKETIRIYSEYNKRERLQYS